MNKNNNLEKLFLRAYDENSESLFRHILIRVSNKETAQDIISETFTKTWDYLKKGNKINNFKGFVYKVADNLIVDFYTSKAKAPLPLIEDANDEPESNGVDFSDKIETKIEFERAKTHLLSLPKEHSQIILLRFVDGLSVGEIKEVTGKTAANIYVIIHRSLKILREKINNEENEE